MAVFQCRSCGHTQSALDKFIGKSVHCPKCGAEATVEPLQAESDAAAPPGSDAPPPSEGVRESAANKNQEAWPWTLAYRIAVLGLLGMLVIIHGMTLSELRKDSAGSAGTYSAPLEVEITGVSSLVELPVSIESVDVELPVSIEDVGSLVTVPVSVDDSSPLPVSIKDSETIPTSLESISFVGQLPVSIKKIDSNVVLPVDISSITTSQSLLVEID